MTQLWLTDTATATKRVFVPLDPENVRVYLCGPTVYDDIHLGNARPMLVVDILVRLLRLLYPKVTYVYNITDIDDKIIQRAHQDKRDPDELANDMLRRFNKAIVELNCKRPDHNPRATEYVPQIISMIEKLIAGGSAYVVDGEVFFSIDSFPDYGKFANKKLEDLIAGARVESDKKKHNPGDFVLWKPAKSGEPQWESPWSNGRPGWHIECSAMSSALLGNDFDIHAGGNDLIFPHHQNEIAQSMACHPGSNFARYWIHNGMVTLNGKKMSKSENHLLKINEALQDFSGDTVRLSLLTAHYRQPLNFSNESLVEAKNRLGRWRKALAFANPTANAAENTPQKNPPLALETNDPVIAALCDDLDLPKALSLISENVTNILKEQDPEKRSTQAATLAQQIELIGISPHKTGAAKSKADATKTNENQPDNEYIENEIAKRKQARATGDFKAADKIRQDLAKQGITLEDSPQGTKWHS